MNITGSPDDAKHWFFVAQDNVRVFSKPNDQSQKQGWLHQGDRVMVLEVYKDWCRLDLNLNTQDPLLYPECWIPAKYLTTDMIPPAPGGNTKVSDEEAAKALRTLIRFVKEQL